MPDLVEVFSETTLEDAECADALLELMGEEPPEITCGALDFFYESDRKVP